ncbi:MAG: SMC-Scp complex subunit ScpB [Inquilinaceae bacterium]
MTDPAAQPPLLTLAEADPGDDLAHWVRLIEALLFAAAEPLDDVALRTRLPDHADLGAVLAELTDHYAGRGVNLVQVAGGWAFRTAPDLTARLRIETTFQRKPTRAALETLAIVAYHQPVTRAEIENIRGVATHKGTLDTLMEAGWVRPDRRRQTPGRPLTWITTKRFLDHFGLAALDDLPGVEELKASGLLDPRPAIQTIPGGRLDDGEDHEEGDDDQNGDRDALHDDADLLFDGDGDGDDRVVTGERRDGT